jgi:catechol 2,3-dioxygenase-like lactoylglutathione lyase family enzyme
MGIRLRQEHGRRAARIMANLRVADVDAEAQKLGYEIVHPIATEPWGVRRFFVRAPDGNVINIVNHRD